MRAAAGLHEGRGLWGGRALPGRDCGEGQACYGSACRAARPGDVCATAVELDLTGGSVLLEADMNANGDALDRRDVSILDEDTWYAVRVPGESLLRITLTGLGFFAEAPRPTVYSGTSPPPRRPR